MPYVANLIARIEGREVTDRRVKELGSMVAKPYDLTAKEIIGFLRVYGPRTVNRLGRDIGDNDLVRRYCEMLKREGIISLEENKRGSQVVVLVKAPAA